MRNKIKKLNLKQTIEQNKSVFFLVGFGIFYLLTFVLLENREVPLHIIYTPFDDVIPFCEYFIIPYLFWFLYVAATIFYFVFWSKNHKERDQFIYSMCAGMAVFLVASFLYPNGHELRPTLTGNGILIELVRILYQVDTSTNILPSLHVFETVVCSIALLRQDEIRKKRGISAGINVSSILIILSTMFLKQHSVIDVISALILNFICYVGAYKTCDRKSVLKVHEIG